MEKTKVNYIIDILMGISFIVTAITSIVLFFFLPSGVKPGAYQTFLGIMKSTWSFYHVCFGMIFIVLALIHLIFHWNWLVFFTKNICKKKN